MIKPKVDMEILEFLLGGQMGLHPAECGGGMPKSSQGRNVGYGRMPR
jgi:hypothetical protein